MECLRSEANRRGWRRLLERGTRLRATGRARFASVYDSSHATHRAVSAPGSLCSLGAPTRESADYSNLHWASDIFLFFWASSRIGGCKLSRYARLGTGDPECDRAVHDWKRHRTEDSAGGDQALRVRLRAIEKWQSTAAAGPRNHYNRYVGGSLLDRAPARHA